MICYQNDGFDDCVKTAQRIHEIIHEIDVDLIGYVQTGEDITSRQAFYNEQRDIAVANCLSSEFCDTRLLGRGCRRTVVQIHGRCFKIQLFGKKQNENEIQFLSEAQSISDSFPKLYCASDDKKVMACELGRRITAEDLSAVFSTHIDERTLYWAFQYMFVDQDEITEKAICEQIGTENFSKLKHMKFALNSLTSQSGMMLNYVKNEIKRGNAWDLLAYANWMMIVRDGQDILVPCDYGLFKKRPMQQMPIRLFRDKAQWAV